MEQYCPIYAEIELYSFLGKHMSLRGYNSNICFPRKLPISPKEFYDQCLTSDRSFEYVRKCDFMIFHHVRLELRLRFLRRANNNMLNDTIVESSETYGKLCIRWSNSGSNRED